MKLCGRLLFGTDVGYMKDYDTTGEFKGPGLAGLSGQDVLRMLTTAPAARLKAASGTLEPGKAGDMVLLQKDPLRDVTAFATVYVTIRGAPVIWRKPR